MTTILWGIVWTLATGILWTLVGVVYSHAAEDKKSYLTFMFCSLLCFGLISTIVSGQWGASSAEIWRLSAIMIPEGVLGQLGFLALCGAMLCGSHGVAWCVSQSAVIFPFLTGWLIFGNHINAWQLLGMVVLLCGVQLLAQGGGRAQARPRRFVVLCITAMTALGVQQSLALLPSHLGTFSEAALSWRMTLDSLGGLAIWGALLLYRRQFVPRCWKMALLYGGLVAAGQWTMYQAIDALNQVHASGLVHPGAIGSCIVFFFLYCRWFRHEKSTRRQHGGIGLVLTGLVLLNCRKP